MPNKLLLSGNSAVSEAMRQVEPDVVAAYPITPQTPIVQEFSQMVADGKVKTRTIEVESEHSAMSATMGAAAAGARAMTATSANGFALMIELVFIAAGLRLPIVMPVVNRSLGGPINIHCDHSDFFASRDFGWIMLMSENNQEAYENTIMAVKIAENHNVLLPVMVNLDGFVTSHSTEPVLVYDDSVIKNFVGSRIPKYTLLDFEKPLTFGSLSLFDSYFEIKRTQIEAMNNSKKYIKQVFEEFSKISGRKYDFIETYKADDADIIIIAMNSTCGTAKVAIDEMRKIGIKVGLLKIRVFRPFPEKEVADILGNAKIIGVLDRAASVGACGSPLYLEILSSLYRNTNNKPLVQNYIYGLGGRDINPDHIKDTINDLNNMMQSGNISLEQKYINLIE
ncbi:MAG: pyruvate ferredoxin oxidoreductase [Spirochaetes bacterium]|nr:pyruvate ferredoxin oxidoreductase [Spirochaetota bacterium]